MFKVKIDMLLLNLEAFRNNKIVPHQSSYNFFFEQKFYSGTHDTTQHPTTTWGNELTLH